MKYLIGTILVLLPFIVSCHSNRAKELNPYLYNILRVSTPSDGYYPISLRVKTSFDKLVTINNQDTILTYKDSIDVVFSTTTLYNDINIDIFNYDDFVNNLILTIEKNNSIKIDSTLFAKYKNYKFGVIVDKGIEDLYNKKGIVGVLNKYLDNEGWLQCYFPSQLDNVIDYHGKGMNINYVIYLAAKHNVYFFCRSHMPDEISGYYLALGLSDKKELKGLKTLNR